METVVWMVKMVWFHGVRSVEVFKINRRIAKSENTSRDISDCETLESFRGNGWFGLRKEKHE